MRNNVWSQLIHFSRTEKWGNPDRMNPFLLLIADRIASKVKLAFNDNKVFFFVHNGFEESGHSEFSQHYLGNAFDFHIEGLSYKAAVRAVECAAKEISFDDVPIENYLGLGIYPEWNNPGFHLDVRGHKSRWGAKYVIDDNGNRIQKYFSYNEIRNDIK